MPKDLSLKKALILGSGPIIIGQAAEFDYSGTQACNSMREENIEVVLVNSNPATIMTDSHIADKVYIEPLTLESVSNIIRRERPDGLLAGFGGQTALNLAMDLYAKGVLDEYGVKLLGVTHEAIVRAEDREAFKALMEDIREPVAPSIIAESVGECVAFAETHAYPLIIRPAYTLGGTGGGIAHDEAELVDICSQGLAASPIKQILLEKSLLGYKEIEYEVMRDSNDNCMIVCNMENIDPVGVHTGDSIVVAPSQTLTDRQYQMLRDAAFKIIRSLKICGGCNIQYALSPDSDEYMVIEVNPRVSRSSALASKATGYPIAKVASKIAIGYRLDELKNSITQNSSAFFEPSLDYVVVKIPKLPFDKFPTAEKSLGTQMKATGEVMSIGRTFEEAFLKALRSLEGKTLSMRAYSFDDLSLDEIWEKAKIQSDQRIFYIGALLRRGVSFDEIFTVTKIDRWFLQGFKNIVDMERALLESDGENRKRLVKSAYKMGYPIAEIERLCGAPADVGGIKPVYKMLDSCAGEFDAKTSYYYSCFDEEDESVPDGGEKILVLGSGPIRIGQGIEFDYCCVHGVWAIKEAGYKSIIINNNPETVSTDFNTADKLYLEPLYIEDVMRIIEKEKPAGVVVQLGGQTAINLAKDLAARGVKILGTSFDSIDMAEDRERFLKVLSEIDIQAPRGFAVTGRDALDEAVEKLGYPVLVRPSYVIGGRAMEIIYDKRYLEKYLETKGEYLENGGLLVDKYIQGKEIEVDALCDGENILIPGIMEHIERTGVHSGDSISVYPAVNLKAEIIETLVDYTKRIGRRIGIKGVFNIQYVYDGDIVRVIEVNPRASRTVPILSKLTGVPMVSIAAKLMLGGRVEDMGFGTGLYRKSQLYGVKIPVFSNEKLKNVDTFLGPEMKSTGEVLGVDKNLDMAIYKSFAAAGLKIVKSGNIYISLSDNNKEEGLEIAKEYIRRGFRIYSSGRTKDYFRNNRVAAWGISNEHLLEFIAAGRINIVINTPTRGDDVNTYGFTMRQKAAQYRVPVYTCLDTARCLLKAIDVKISGVEPDYLPISGGKKEDK
ncbi:MAG: carbamoyl-phosphate synthase (glutamine-hydrolyzing) large subunit [Oscillospiraceae bacterium]|jgi:carbamoyl-phosphate synthase large subunit|nr:carbamoyl-phosphate synthase (glutamine-hydrolyzing) large subunit [Oscillospiraceae bacterium]